MWPNPWETADLVTFIKEIRNRILDFLCSENYRSHFRLYTNLSFLVEITVYAVDASSIDLEILRGEGASFERKGMW